MYYLLGPCYRLLENKTLKFDIVKNVYAIMRGLSKKNMGDFSIFEQGAKVVVKDSAYNCIGDNFKYAT